MFIHIGNANVIRSQDIIAIIDYHLIASSVIMDEMIKRAFKEKNIIGPAVKAKSLVITKDMIYYTTISVATLQKRANMISTISKLEDYSDQITP
ncbi:DUF370 domain-containing protein [Oceanobacillus zhaokaii]|jgi:hypothetical protein|uniref:DUF370 domain-containing protein n=1 Tax=Oceanobacillus zhaokaii TaxID=2052660 RepID=A0A345PBW5_9BACI|nr:extracellular matrix/biofilm biosynthesis regulator RemA family protein [Oceanobacillus zhaokaii]AXI07495.1 DUF370 domain-containing protein [Oceanobacillus zhaokaii]